MGKNSSEMLQLPLKGKMEGFRSDLHCMWPSVCAASSLKTEWTKLLPACCYVRGGGSNASVKICFRSGKVFKIIFMKSEVI